MPASHRTAQHGNWVTGPGADLFDVVFSDLGSLPIIAEDLGVITAGVEDLRDRYNFPGMKILQFAFGSDSSNPYLPHNHEKNCVVYTGTHDNDTSLGWCNSLSSSQRGRVTEYLGCNDDNCVQALLRTSLMSVADTVVLPFQDLLLLDSDARMNIPGKAFGNWSWRFKWDMLAPDLALITGDMIERYGRHNNVAKQTS